MQTAFDALAWLDREHAAVYFQIIWDMLREPMREALVMEQQTEGKIELAPATQRAMDGDLGPIEPLIERIVAQLAPEEIWLFGSRAEGRARPDSDYDLLAVLSDDAPESALDLLKAWELTCGLGVPADLVPCTRSEFEADKDEVGTLARAAYQRGRCIYER